MLLVALGLHVCNVDQSAKCNEHIAMSVLQAPMFCRDRLKLKKMYIVSKHTSTTYLYSYYRTRYN